jgi:GMP synthase-like glutamine amidotransferase
MRIACVRHVSFEGPGTIAEWAASRGHTIVEIAAPTGEYPAPGSFDMLVLLGGPMGVYDIGAHPWLVAERAFIASAIDAGALVLGVCLGAQLLADAVGGSVRSGPEPEIGWFPVRLTDAGRASPLFAGWPDSFVAGHWHGDTFDLMPPLVAAASSQLTANQAFEACDGRAAGLQFHLEWTPAVLSALLENCGDELAAGGTWVQPASELLGDAAEFERSRDLLFEMLDRLAVGRRRRPPGAHGRGGPLPSRHLRAAAAHEADGATCPPARDCGHWLVPFLDPNRKDPRST